MLLQHRRQPRKRLFADGRARRGGDNVRTFLRQTQQLGNLPKTAVLADARLKQHLSEPGAFGLLVEHLLDGLCPIGDSHCVGVNVLGMPQLRCRLQQGIAGDVSSRPAISTIASHR